MYNVILPIEMSVINHRHSYLETMKNLHFAVQNGKKLKRETKREKDKIGEMKYNMVY